MNYLKEIEDFTNKIKKAGDKFKLKLKNMKRINDKEVDEILEFVGLDNAGGPIYYLDGEPFNGIIESFYDNGNLMDEVEFTDGHIGGVLREYYETGQLKMEYYKYFAKPDGDWKDWDEDGNLIHHSIWKEGVKIETLVD